MNIIVSDTSLMFNKTLHEYWLSKGELIGRQQDSQSPSVFTQFNILDST